MAWFRCGGSGIPASLKSGMNSVLNKKFGTSTTYDPAGWPADVNLLGPLPVKSASGAIASFADGADGVPVKSCVVSFLPSGGGGTPSAPVAIVGHSGITLTNKDNMSTPTHTDTYTDTFGQTIYGGTRDLTTDKASVTYKHYDLSQISWSGGIIGGQMWCWYADKSADGLKLPTNSAIFDGLCDRYTPIRYNGVSTGENTIALRSNGYLYVNNGSDTVEPTGEVIIAYATAQEITGLTPHEIDTLYGDNNIYADTGTTNVEYRAGIDLALNA